MPHSNKNQTVLSGLLVAEPELQVENERPVLHMEVRSRRFCKRRGEWVEYYEYLDIDVHGDQARPLDERLSKGDVVDIAGRLESRKRPVLVDGEFVYDGEEEKVTYRAVTIVATKVTPLSSRPTEAEPDKSGAAAASVRTDEVREDGPPAGSTPDEAAQPPATPKAIELATEKGIDLAKVEGHGQPVDGTPMITKADVEAAAKTASKEAGEAADLRREAAAEVAGGDAEAGAQAS